jgi:PIN domain nuclease of toxin-antitoxin system
MTQCEFWRWLSSEVEQQILRDPFKQIHPAKIRRVAAQVFGFDPRDFVATCVWQERHKSQIHRTINAAARKHGLRLAKSVGGYSQLVAL